MEHLEGNHFVLGMLAPPSFMSILFIYPLDATAGKNLRVGLKKMKEILQIAVYRLETAFYKGRFYAPHAREGSSLSNNEYLLRLAPALSLHGIRQRLFYARPFRFDDGKNHCITYGPIRVKAVASEYAILMRT